MNNAMYAITKKDLRGITSNKQFFAVLLIVPLVLTILLPTIFVLGVHFMPEESGDFEKLLKLLPMAEQAGDVGMTIIKLVLNNIMPVFFLIIPIMSASIMSASSFIGEKEKHTLETLLYCPLPLKQIFRAKILASFFLSMLVSFISFAAMIVVFEIEVYMITGSLILPDVSWLIIMFLVAPAISFIAITLIVRRSAKAQTMEEAQQSAVFLVLPVVLLMVGQFTGILLISSWILLGLGIVLALLAFILVKNSMGRFNYEMLLK